MKDFLKILMCASTFNRKNEFENIFMKEKNSIQEILTKTNNNIFHLLIQKKKIEYINILNTLIKKKNSTISVEKKNEIIKKMLNQINKEDDSPFSLTIKYGKIVK